MDKMEGLRAGVTEMRSVAQRLNQWADDLEQLFRDQEAAKKEMDAGKPAPAEKKKKAAADKAAAEPAAEEKKAAPLTLPEVRAVLAEKCSKGFSTQVKALIESFGVSTLRDVAPEHYGELLEAVKGLGDADAG